MEAESSTEIYDSPCTSPLNMESSATENENISSKLSELEAYMSTLKTEIDIERKEKSCAVLHVQKLRNFIVDINAAIFKVLTGFQRIARLTTNQGVTQTVNIERKHCEMIEKVQTEIDGLIQQKHEIIQNICHVNREITKVLRTLEKRNNAGPSLFEVEKNHENNGVCDTQPPSINVTCDVSRRSKRNCVVPTRLIDEITTQHAPENSRINQSELAISRKFVGRHAIDKTNESKNTLFCVRGRKFDNVGKLSRHANYYNFERHKTPKPSNSVDSVNFLNPIPEPIPVFILKNRVTCPDCETLFETKKEMITHKWKEHKVNEQKNISSHQPEIKNLTINLSLHGRDHTKATGYFCVCGWGKFKTRKTLQSHIKRYTMEKKFVCQHCHKRFLGADALRKHLITKHGTKPGDKSTFGCRTCGKLFKTMYYLLVHQKTSHKQCE